MTFKLQTTSSTDPFADDSKWVTNATCKIKDTGNHLANWREAYKSFVQSHADTMVRFGDGSVAITGGIL